MILLADMIFRTKSKRTSPIRPARLAHRNPPRWRPAPGIITLLAIGLTVSCNQHETVDLLVHGGTIYTLDEDFSTAEAMAVDNGRIIATGSNEDILGRFRSDAPMDLEDAFVYPGLIDAHCHFVGYSNGLLYADLSGTDSFDEIIGILKSKQGGGRDEWILGRGWDQNDWEAKEFPDKSVLDQAFPETPVFLTRIDGHAAIANSVALRRAGIHARTRVQGGSILMSNGEPSGVLIDNAMGLVRRVIPQPSQQQLQEMLLEAQGRCFEVGLTSVHDAGLPYKTIRLIDSLQRQDLLKIRMYAMLSPGTEDYEAFFLQGPYQSDHLHVRSIKLFADGTLGSRGALLLEPYADDPGNVGLAVEDDRWLRQQCSLALEYGFQVSTHCIGDSANRWILNMYRDFLKGENDLRWRIEHAQVIHPDDMHLFGDYNIIPSIQSTHATSDMYWAADRLGKERLKGAYAYRELMEQNGWLANGSDFPVESINPLFGFYALVARKDHEGYPEGGFQPENALSREAALKAMTIWAAKAAFEEDEKGSLEAGKLADFVVCDEDLLRVEASAIPGIKIQATCIGGDMVFSRGPDHTPARPSVAVPGGAD